jgi:hypothetical protein
VDYETGEVSKEEVMRKEKELEEINIDKTDEKLEEKLEEKDLIIEQLKENISR